MAFYVPRIFNDIPDHICFYQKVTKNLERAINRLHDNSNTQWEIYYEQLFIAYSNNRFLKNGPTESSYHTRLPKQTWLRNIFFCCKNIILHYLTNLNFENYYSRCTKTVCLNETGSIRSMKWTGIIYLWHLDVVLKSLFAWSSLFSSMFVCWSGMSECTSISRWYVPTVVLSAVLWTARPNTSSSKCSSLT